MAEVGRVTNRITGPMYILLTRVRNVDSEDVMTLEALNRETVC